MLAPQIAVGIAGVVFRGGHFHAHPSRYIFLVRRFVSNVDTLTRRAVVNTIAAQRRETEFLCLDVVEPLPPAGHGGLFPPVICQFIATPTAAYWYCMQALHLRRALLAEHSAHPAVWSLAVGYTAYNPGPERP